LREIDADSKAVLLLRWVARVWGSAIVALVALFAVMQAVTPDAPAPTGRDWVGLLFFPAGLCVGLVMAWRWEAAGGAIAVGSYLAFYAWMLASGGGLPSGPYFALAAVPGILFLLCRLLSGRRRGARPG
jgi:hypothetical protein